MLVLEGLFRSFTTKVQRDDAGLLSFDRGGRLVGPGRSRAGPAGGGGRENRRDDGGNDADVRANPCYTLTGSAVSRVSAQLQQELLSGKLVPYLTEWCATDPPREKGIAFSDCSYHYDPNGENVIFRTRRSASNDIHLGIRYALLGGIDPVLQAAIDRVEAPRAIPNALKFEQARLAQCKQGRNVDAITLYRGPGGVGLSMRTVHLHA